MGPSNTTAALHGAAEQREITRLGCVPPNSKRTCGARVKSPGKQTVVATPAFFGAHSGSEIGMEFSAAEVFVEALGHRAALSVFEGFLNASDAVLPAGNQARLSADAARESYPERT